jgi:hypothetical protein
MLKLKLFFKTLKLSFTDPKYYLDVLKAKFSFSLKFFLVAFLLLSLTRSLKFIFLEIPQLKSDFNQTLSQVKNNYPENLVIKWNQDNLELEGPEFLEVSYPSFVKTNSEMPPKFAYLTNNEINENNINKNFLINFDQQNLFAFGQPNYQSMPLKSLAGFEQEFTLDQEKMLEILPEVDRSFENLLKNLTYLSPILFFIGLILSRIWIVFFEIILAFLLIKINKLKISFKKLIQISLHIVVVLEIIWQISKLLYPTHNLALINIGFWVILIFIYWTNKKALRG